MHLLVIVSSDLFGLLARCSIKILHSNYTPQTKDKNHLSSYAFLSPLIGGPTPPLLSHTKAAYMYHEPCCSCIPLSFNVIQHAAIRSRSQEQHAATRTSLPSVLGAVRRPAPFRCITPAASLRAQRLLQTDSSHDEEPRWPHACVLCSPYRPAKRKTNLPTGVCHLSVSCPTARQVKDACGCCVVCAAGEGEACGKRSSGHLSCGNGLRCDSGPGKAGGLHSLCMCASSSPVCGSDGRTYPSICRLRAENRRAELGETSPVFLIQRGRCDSGKLWDISFGLISHLCCFPLSFLFSLKRDLCITDMKQQLLKLKLWIILKNDLMTTFSVEQVN